MRKKGIGKGFKTAILFLIILVCGFLFIHSSVFNLKEVKISGNGKVSTDEIMALSGITTGANIFVMNKTIAAKSIEIHPMIKKALIKRQVPATILVEITERKVWGIIPKEGAYLLVDDEGVCIDKVNSVSMDHPLITMDEYPERVNLGQAVNPEAIDMVRKVWLAIPDDQRSQISEMHYVNKSQMLLIYTLKGTEVRFGNLDRLDEKVQTFGEIFKIEETFEAEGKEVLQYVDIRYKGQPVVKTGK